MRPQGARKVVIVAIALAVAAAHLYTGPGYRGPLRWFVTGYAIDVLLPFSSYFLLVLAGLPKWPLRVAAVFLTMAGAEFAQAKGAALFGRTYDPWDFVAYLTGALLAAAADKFLFPRLFGFWNPPTAATGSQRRSAALSGPH